MKRIAALLLLCAASAFGQTSFFNQGFLRQPSRQADLDYLGIGSLGQFQTNFFTTNGPSVININDPGANRIVGWDDTDNQLLYFTIGANLTYTHATHTLSASAGGSGVHVATPFPGMLSSNAGPTLVTITNIPAQAVSGTLTNNTTGNALTATTATFVTDLTTNFNGNQFSVAGAFVSIKSGSFQTNTFTFGTSWFDIAYGNSLFFTNSLTPAFSSFDYSGMAAFGTNSSDTAILNIPLNNIPRLLLTSRFGELTRSVPGWIVVSNAQGIATLTPTNYTLIVGASDVRLSATNITFNGFNFYPTNFAGGPFPGWFLAWDGVTTFWSRNGGPLSNINAASVSGPGVLPTNVVPTIVQSNFLASQYVSGQGVTALEDFETYAVGTPTGADLTNGYGWAAAPTGSNWVLNSLTFNDSFPDHYLEITNGFWSRRLAISNNWRYLRLGIQWSVAPNAAANIAGCLAAIGVSSSKGAGYEGFGAGTTSNFLGWVSCSANFTNGQNFQYVANSGDPYYQGGTDKGCYMNLRSLTVTNKTIAIAAGGAFCVPYNTGNSGPRRFIVQTIPDKSVTGAAFFGQGLVGISSAPNTVEDFDGSRLWSIVRKQRDSNTDDNSLTASTVINTLAFSEATYQLDSINIYWNNPTNALQVYQILVHAYY